MFNALGLVEVLGSADAIQVVDVMLKTSDVEFQTWNTKCGGHTTVFVSGDVASVTEAVEHVKTNSPCDICKAAVISNPSEEAERLVLESRESSRFARAAFEKAEKKVEKKAEVKAEEKAEAVKTETKTTAKAPVKTTRKTTPKK